MKIDSLLDVVLVQDPGLPPIVGRFERPDFVLREFSNWHDALRAAHWDRVGAIVADLDTLTEGLEPTVRRLARAIDDLRSAQHAALGDEDEGWQLPIILMTESEAVDEHARALAAGADLVLSRATASYAEIVSHYLDRLMRHWKRRLDPHNIDIAPPRSDVRASSVFDLPTGRFRSPSGRFHAGYLADALGVPLNRLAAALEAPYTTVHKTPDSEALQPRLAALANVLAMLDQVYSGDEARVRAWLRSERPELGGRTPLAALLEPGGAYAVEQFVTASWLGEAD